MNDANLRAQLPQERRLPADRRNELREQLMATIEHEAETEATGTDKPTEISTRRNRRRRRVIGGAVAVVALAGAATAAAAMVNRDRPDPEQARQVEESFEPMVGEIYEPGWRHDLNAETVECVYPLPEADPGWGNRITATASHFPLDGTLTAAHLAETCTTESGPEGLGYDPFPVESGTVCVQPGELPRPVVLVDVGSCEEFPEEELMPIGEDHLAELNRLRAIEVAALAVPTDDGCATYEEARDWALEQAEAAGEEGLAVGEDLDEGSGCYLGVIYWDERMVWPQPIAPGPAD
jgi:hypothetical protein